MIFFSCSVQILVQNNCCKSGNSPLCFIVARFLQFVEHFIMENDLKLQSTLVISTLVIWNNSLSRRENLVRVLTQKSKIRLQNIVEKRRNFVEKRRNCS